MQFAAERCQVAPCGLRFRQPPRLWAFGVIRPGLSRGCIHLRHAPRSYRGRLPILAASGPSTSPVEQINQSGTAPAASEIAAKETPGSQVATPEALDEARERRQQKPNEAGVDSSPQHMDAPVVNDSDPRATDVPGGQRPPASASGQPSSSGPRQGGQSYTGQGPPPGSRPLGGRSASRAAKRPRTVRKEQLVAGGEFEGTIVSVMAYGAFVDIGSVTDGLVHVSQIADSYVADPAALLRPGQVVTVRVVNWDEKASRLSLTMRSTTDSGGPGSGTSGFEKDATRAKQEARRGKVATAATERRVKRGSEEPILVKAGDELQKVKVEAVLSWGAFVDVGNGHRGLLHVDEMRMPGDMMDAVAKDIMKPGQLVNVRVLKVGSGKIQLTQREEAQRTVTKKAETETVDVLDMIDNRGGRSLLGSALGGVGFKLAPRAAKEETGNGVTAVPADQIPSSISAASDATSSIKNDKSAQGVLDSAASDISPASASNDASPELNDQAQKDALERQINPTGSPTPVDLPPEAQKAADEAGADEAALEGDDSPGGTADQSTPLEVTAPSDESAPSPVPDAAAEGASSKEGADAGTGAISTSGAELDKGIEEDALKRQTEPKGSPTPVQLPPEVQKAAEEAKQDADKPSEVKAQATEAAPSSPIGAGPSGPNAAAASSPIGAGPGGPTASAASSPIEAGTSGAAPSSPGKESQLPSNPPPEVGEGENPDVKQAHGTEEETEIQVTVPPEESDSAKAKPEDIAEGEESPAATKAAASDASQSAASLSGAAPASQLPGTHNQTPQAAPAKPVGQGTTGAEGITPPASAAASSFNVGDSAASVGTSSPPAGGGGGSVSAVATGSAVSAQAVKQLRLDTGAGMMDCKRALTQANGDFKLATEALRKKGLAAADKKAGRIAAEGLLAEYIHAGSRLGVLLEINCETDFVAKGDIFKALANDMAMQVAACPQVTVVDSADVPADVVDKERTIQMGKEDILKKPEQIRGKIVDGRIQKFVSEQALLEQDFIKDTSKTVATVIREASAAIGEKISLRRFERYHLGEGITKKESDLAAEVEQQQQALKDKAAEKKAQGPQEAAPEPEQQQAPSVKVDAKLVKQLRESSGAGMMDCKKALASNDNNLEKATEFLRKKGLASADKKAGRVASEGAIGAYVHAGSKLGVLIEVNCETDFVARGAKFKELVQDLAMQAAASSSAIVVAVQDVPESEIEKERQIEMGKEDIQSKPEAIRPKIVEGRLGKIRSQKALLEQQFIKDTSVTVADHIKQAIANLGENIQVRRFERYNLGEGIEKKSQDFAAEVAAQTGQ